MTKKTDKLELNLDSGYGKDDSVENYVKIDDVLGLEGRTDDPDNPYPGERWFREDEGVIREAYVDSSGNIDKLDKKTIYDVPSETEFETFEGGDTSEYNDPDDILSAQQSIVYEGSWVGKVDHTGGASTATALSGTLDNRPQRGDTFLFALKADDIGGGVAFGAVDGANTYSLNVPDSSNLNLNNISGGNQSQLDDFDPTGTLNTTEWNVYTISFGEPTISVEYDGQTILSADDSEHDGDKFGYFVPPDGVFYVDSLEQITDKGQLSPALAHSDLADAPAGAHHTQPTDEEQTFTISGSTEEATTVTLSQAYKSGIANCGFTSGANISPANDADCYVQDYVTDGDGNITDVVVYAHNTTGNSLDIDVRFFGVPA
jgi:hypothetical protein